MYPPLRESVGLSAGIAIAVVLVVVLILVLVVVLVVVLIPIVIVLIVLIVLVIVLIVLHDGCTPLFIWVTTSLCVILNVFIHAVGMIKITDLLTNVLC